MNVVRLLTSKRLVLGLAVLSLLVPAISAPQPPEAERAGLDQEEGNRRREWNLEWYGEEWTDEYRDQLYRIGELQRIKHPQTLQLAASMRRATRLPAAAPGNTWINLGPVDGGVDYDVTERGTRFQRTILASDSGRPSQIVPHPLEPDTLFLVAAEGGLWKTTTAGASWTPLTEGEPSLALGALAIDPVTPSILYLGLGDVKEGSFGGTGTGILKSTDRGQTWTRPITLGKSRAVTSILVDPGNTSLLLVGTDAGLFRSTDAGENYAPVSLPSGNPKTIGDITWIDDNRLVLAVSNRITFGEFLGGANILVSPDQGATWKPAQGLGPRDSILRFSLAAAPSDRDVLYALASNTDGHLFEIFKSEDGGSHWAPTNAASIRYTNPLDQRPGPSTLLGNQGGYNQMVIVDPLDPDKAFFGGALNLVRTLDGGASYSVISDWLGAHGLPYVHADFHCAAFDARGRLWIGHDGGLARSSDGGASWSTVENRGLTTHLVYSVGSSPHSRDAVIIGLQDNGTRVRNGATNVFPQRAYADGFGAVIHPLDSRIILASLYFTRILKSRDGSRSFHGSYDGITEADQENDAPFFTKIVPAEGDATGNTVYTFVNKRIYKSTSFGDSWSAIEVDGLVGNIRNLAVAKRDGQSLALVSDGGVFLSTDGGRSWDAAGSLPGSSGRLSHVSFSPVDPKTLYVASVAPRTTATHLWKSTDGGASWTAIDTVANFPKGAPVNIVIGDPGDGDTVYAGTHFGLYKSTDGGENWSRFGSGLPLVSVTDIYVSPDSSLVRVATYGRGVWQLTE